MRHLAYSLEFIQMGQQPPSDSEPRGHGRPVPVVESPIAYRKLRGPLHGSKCVEVGIQNWPKFGFVPRNPASDGLSEQMARRIVVRRFPHLRQSKPITERRIISFVRKRRLRTRCADAGKNDNKCRQ